MKLEWGERVGAKTAQGTSLPRAAVHIYPQALFWAPRGSIYLFLHVFIVYMCAHRGQTSGDISLVPLCGLWGSNKGCQAWGQTFSAPELPLQLLDG